MKVLFCHPVRTRGTTINALFRAHDHEGARISWDTIERDWLIDELHGFLWDERASFIHQHAGNLSEKIASAFRAKSWRLMVSIRHVGDQLCSIWHSTPGMQYLVTLDQFIIEQMQGGNVPSWAAQQWEVPRWADDADIIIEDVADVEKMLNRKAEHRLNASVNPGWKQLLQDGAISTRAVELVQESRQMRVYEALRDRSLRDR